MFGRRRFHYFSFVEFMLHALVIRQMYILFDRQPLLCPHPPILVPAGQSRARDSSWTGGLSLQRAAAGSYARWGRWGGCSEVRHGEPVEDLGPDGPENLI